MNSFLCNKTLNVLRKRPTPREALGVYKIEASEKIMISQ